MIDFTVLSIQKYQQQYQDKLTSLSDATDSIEVRWKAIKQSESESEKIRFYVPSEFIYSNVFSDMNGVRFTFLGSGNFNVAYEFEDPTRKDSTGKNLRSVVKMAIHDIRKIFLHDVHNDNEITVRANDCRRSVRLWNEINDKRITPNAYVKLLTFSSGRSIHSWVTAFIEPFNIEASPELICKLLYDIFVRCNRIVVDVLSSNNVGKTEEGYLVCLDVSFALRLIRMTETNTRRQMEASQISLDFWCTMRDTYAGFFKKTPQTQYCVVEMIKSLLYLQQVEFNQEKNWEQRMNFFVIYNARALLADCYDRPDKNDFDQRLLLEKDLPVTLFNDIQSDTELDGNLKTLQVPYKVKTDFFQNLGYARSRIIAFSQLLTNIALSAPEEKRWEMSLNLCIDVQREALEVLYSARRAPPVGNKSSASKALTASLFAENNGSSDFYHKTHAEDRSYFTQSDARNVGYVVKQNRHPYRRQQAFFPVQPRFEHNPVVSTFQSSHSLWASAESSRTGAIAGVNGSGLNPRAKPFEPKEKPAPNEAGVADSCAQGAARIS